MLSEFSILGPAGQIWPCMWLDLVHSMGDQQQAAQPGASPSPFCTMLLIPLLLLLPLRQAIFTRGPLLPSHLLRCLPKVNSLFLQPPSPKPWASYSPPLCPLQHVKLSSCLSPPSPTKQEGGPQWQMGCKDPVCCSQRLLTPALFIMLTL